MSLFFSTIEAASTFKQNLSFQFPDHHCLDIDILFLKKNNQPYSPLLIFSLETPQESKSSASVTASVTIYIESPEEFNTFRPIQNPVNNSDTAEEEVIDEDYWNHPLEEINATSSDDSSAESGNLFSQSKLLSQKSYKKYSGPSKYEEHHSWLYFSKTNRGWMCKICEKYPYSGGASKELFLQGHAKIQFILAMNFVNMKGRKDIYV